MKIIESLFVIFMTLFVGATIGSIWTDIPNIKFNNSFNVSELTNIFLTIFVTFFYTKWITKKIEDNKDDKIMILAELTDVCGRLDNIQEMILENIDQELHKIHMGKILYRVEEIASIIGSVNERLELYYPGKTEKIRTNLLEGYFAFKRQVTGDGLALGKMLDDDFFKACRVEKGNFVSKIKINRGAINHL